jgi:hypothetical protein
VGIGSRLKATLIALTMLAACLALWTASPVLWLWVGSQIDRGGPPSMTAIVTVVIGILSTSAGLAWLLAALHRAYRTTRGGPGSVKLRMPWLGSGGQGTKGRPRELELTVLDIILIGSVFLAVGLYEYWFLFEAGSPIDQRTGRR